jgi:hypothetical protein
MPTRIFDNILAAVISWSFLLTLSLSAQAEPKDLTDDLLLFSGEVVSYIDLAKEIRKRPEAEFEKGVENLKAIGMRAAGIYFRNMTKELQPQLDQYLGKTLKTNPEIETYFVFLGNAFLSEAARLMEQQAAEARVLRIRSTIGGTVLGLATGGGYLFIKAKYLAPGVALGAKDYLMASAAVIGFAGAGYGAGSYYAAYRLPTNWAVQNAKEFKARYPLGEDFIRDLRGNLNVADLRDRMERILEEDQ